MKYVDEFRNPEAARAAAEGIRASATRPWTLMEICGGQTHTIVRYGIEELLPGGLSLLHGPGCPVCVTPLETIDRAIAIAGRPEVIFVSFGDMLRVPGSEADLLSVKARGADVRIAYSPLDALRLARNNPDRQVVFFAVGFETTAPANAATVKRAAEQGIGNFSIIGSHVLVPPAVEAILSSPGNRVQAFLAAGHVCAVMGTGEYAALSEKYGVPMVITGFEPADVLMGILAAVRMLERGDQGVENRYARTVRAEGNPLARGVMREVFEVCDRTWRGIGEIPSSGLRLRAEYAAFDAERRFDVASIQAVESPLCIAGNVLRGLNKPADCEAFGKECSPERPLGAPMVSSEGVCAAYYRYRRTGG